MAQLAQLECACPRVRINNNNDKKWHSSKANSLERISTFSLVSILQPDRGFIVGVIFYSHAVLVPDAEPIT